MNSYDEEDLDFKAFMKKLREDAEMIKAMNEDLTESLREIEFQHKAKNRVRRYI